MRITIHSKHGRMIWFRECLTDQPLGMTSEAYRCDGTLTAIIEALSEALDQAISQSCGALEVSNIVTDICAPATQIDHRIPVATVGHGNPCRQIFIESAKVAKLSALAIVLKVGIVHDEDVALMRTFHNDNVARI
jgi:hypothetical protein